MEHLHTTVCMWSNRWIQKRKYRVATKILAVEDERDEMLQAKSVPARELRESRTPTKRYVPNNRGQHRTSQRQGGVSTCTDLGQTKNMVKTKGALLNKVVFS
ncbi:hypothetical protein J6590_094662 [Homalodisca vitripennis]|nr:hypothetical protein J6590_094662 [Homalodisca vitripennis]